MVCLGRNLDQLGFPVKYIVLIPNRNGMLLSSAHLNNRSNLGIYCEAYICMLQQKF